MQIFDQLWQFMYFICQSIEKLTFNFTKIPLQIAWGIQVQFGSPTPSRGRHNYSSFREIIILTCSACS